MMAHPHPATGPDDDAPDRGERSPQDRTGGGSWHPGNHASEPLRILNLLFEFRAAEQRLRATSRGSVRLGETDLLALRYLLEAQAAGRVMRQKDLAEHLGVSTASVSGLIDRLGDHGYLRRIPHPEDRRSVAIELTDTTEDDFRASQNEMHARILQVIEALTPSEQHTVDTFLTSLIEAFDRHPTI